ncbi:MAG: DUF1501 domain-containing protein [Bacteroidota bacterium]
MKRRDFLQKAITASAIPLFINGFPIQALADNPIVQFLGKTGAEDRVLVLIQLNGGNDGLNTVIPLDQYSKLMLARPNIIIQQNKVLTLSGTQATGLHPSLSEIRSLYDNAMIKIVQSVGYPDPNFSHFRATDIWLTGSDSNVNEETGWLGRYLDTKFENFPVNYPNTNYPDPPAIQIGAMVSPALQGHQASLGMSITDPTSFYQFVNGTVDPAPNTPAGHELTYVRLVAQQTQQYSGTIKAAADKATNLSTLYPATGQNTLADQLKIVAQLIAGGLKTQVYMVSLGGFDTHASQTDASATETGTHANLMQKISQAVNAFQDDLKKLAIDERVLGMTFSEFGRRIKSNDSLGTDHGAAAPLFIFGKKVKPGITGNNPIIPDVVTTNDNVPMQVDFRAIYASILKYWFNVSDAELNPLLLNKTFPLLDIIADGNTSIKETEAAKIGVLENFPNPVTSQTTIRFTCSGGYVKIRLFDNVGREILTIAENNFSKGTHEVVMQADSLSNGTYYYQVQQGQSQLMKTMIVAK